MESLLNFVCCSIYLKMATRKFSSKIFIHILGNFPVIFMKHFMVHYHHRSRFLLVNFGLFLVKNLEIWKLAKILEID